ncbi:restriction endonuclease subunit S [Candidatus Saccharibacteria bacterium]|nr:restriction endonuclease subunit S [Candidatus Saccharibacteria bacterium]
MNPQQMTPELRFPEFSGEWQMKKLGDVASKVGSGSTPRGGSKVYKQAGIPFVRSQNVNGGKLDLSDIVYIDRQTHDFMANSSIKPLDVLLNITGASLGRTCVVPASFDEGNLSQHVCIIRLEKTNPYIVHTILSKTESTNELLKAQTGGGKEGLNFQAVRAFKLNLPQKPEQEKIAEFLTAVDARIAAGEQKLASLAQYKKAVMQQIFSQQIRFKDESGNPYPEWEENRLGDIGNTYNGLTGKSGVDFGEGSPFITYTQIFSNTKISKNYGYVRISPSEKQNTAQYGDIFFTTSSETPEETGYTSVLLDEVDNLYLNSFCFGYRAKKSELLPEFARYIFHSMSVRQAIVRLAQGSTRYNISKSEVMKLSIRLPSIEEQQKITTFLTALDARITTETTRLASAKAWKKGLLQRMFV